MDFFPASLCSYFTPTIEILVLNVPDGVVMLRNIEQLSMDLEDWYFHQGNPYQRQRISHQYKMMNGSRNL